MTGPNMLPYLRTADRPRGTQRPVTPPPRVPQTPVTPLEQAAAQAFAQRADRVPSPSHGLGFPPQPVAPARAPSPPAPVGALPRVMSITEVLAVLDQLRAEMNERSNG